MGSTIDRGGSSISMSFFRKGKAYWGGPKVWDT